MNKSMLYLAILFILICGPPKVKAESVVDFSYSTISETELTAFLRNVKGLVSLNLAYTDITDAVCDQLGAQDKLVSLNLSGSNINDSGLKKLRGLMLSDLNLSRTSVTSLGIESISNIHTLSTLNLSNTNITDDSLGYICKLGSLRELNLGNTNLTGKSLAALLLKCKSLHTLRLSSEKFQSRYFNKFQSSSLVVLCISNSKLDDDCLIGLGQLTTLQVLSISANDITDNGLRHLSSLKNLRCLSCIATKVSDRALEDLSKLLPYLSYFR